MVNIKWDLNTKPSDVLRQLLEDARKEDNENNIYALSFVMGKAYAIENQKQAEDSAPRKYRTKSERATIEPQISDFPDTISKEMGEG